MSTDQQQEQILAILKEIRDQQRVALEQQRAHLEIAKEQIERSRTQVEESIGLQRFAIDRFRKVTIVAVPLIVLCLALILYLTLKFF